ncbi:MAG TPA: GGDEF domain-containing protein [Candidatus Acidoferrales bacterium]|nr:GGDEF domain-containing protein [Candidatus Acidoferrales bacterium]
MSKTDRIWNFLKQPHGTWLYAVSGCGILALAWWLRRLPDTHDPLLYGQLQFTSGLLALIFAIAAGVRFRGTQDRLPLVLAFGFVIVGVVLCSSSFAFIHPASSASAVSLRDPMSWVVSRTLLALLLVSALVVEQRLPKAQSPRREILVALGTVVLLVSLLGAIHLQLPAELVVASGGPFPRPGNLFPAALFLLAAIGFRRRLKKTSAPFDRSLFFSTALNVGCCLAASQSLRRLDAPFAFAETLQFTSYAVLVGGALADNLQLFESIRHLAVSDSLTGLANYRRLIDTVEREIQRSRRTGRPLALLLFDLDGLKQVNDRYGHLVGTRALCRIADVIRLQSRAIDTGARHGGDEFALVLPETDRKAAQEVAQRICSRVAADAEEPRISVSAGVAICPQDGETVEKLLGAADRALYESKRRASFRAHATK